MSKSWPLFGSSLQHSYFAFHILESRIMTSLEDPEFLAITNVHLSFPLKAIPDFHSLFPLSYPQTVTVFHENIQILQA